SLQPDPQYAEIIEREPPSVRGAAPAAYAAEGQRVEIDFEVPATAPARIHPDAPAQVRVRVVREDTLMRESALVAEARGALMRGDAEKALAVLRGAKALKHRELEPEELSLEAKALRAAGREDAAIETERVLRTKFPEHALAR